MQPKKGLFIIVLAIILTVPLVLTGNIATAPSITPPHIYMAPPQKIPYDYDPPTVLIESPTNATYDSNSILLNLTVSKPQSWNNETMTYGNVTEYVGQIYTIMFGLDGQWTEANLTAPDDWTSTAPISFEISLPNLENGPHLVSANASGWCLFAPTLFAYRYSNFVSGSSETVNFTVNVPPRVSLLSPLTEAYNSSYVTLNYTVDKPVSSVWYCLDGEANVTICGNATITQLTPEQHDVQVYAQVLTGGIGSSTKRSFTVTFPPKVMLLEPNDTIYTSETIPLNFSSDKPIAWAAYRLDNQNDTIILGNTTLQGLSDGLHTITIYAKDAFGNEGVSLTVPFSRFPIAAPAPPSSTLMTIKDNIPMIVSIALATVASITLISVALKKRRRRVTLDDFFEVE